MLSSKIADMEAFISVCAFTDSIPAKLLTLCRYCLAVGNLLHTAGVMDDRPQARDFGIVFSVERERVFVSLV